MPRAAQAALARQLAPGGRLALGPGLAARAALGKGERAKPGQTDEGPTVVTQAVYAAVELVEGRLDLGDLAAAPVEKGAPNLVVQRLGGAGRVLGRLAAIPILVPGGKSADRLGKLTVPGLKE